MFGFKDFEDGLARFLINITWLEDYIFIMLVCEKSESFAKFAVVDESVEDLKYFVDVCGGRF